MTYYQAEISRIKNNILPRQYLVDRAIRAKQMIDRRYCENISLTEIAGESFLSKFHLIRLFKTCYGRTPHQMITEKRVHKAQFLLRQGFSVSETCFQLGFDSPASFSLFFKKHIGLTPSGYQKKQFLINRAG